MPDETRLCQDDLMIAYLLILRPAYTTGKRYAYGALGNGAEMPLVKRDTAFCARARCQLIVCIPYPERITDRAERGRGWAFPTICRGKHPGGAMLICWCILTEMLISRLSHRRRLIAFCKYRGVDRRRTLITDR
jgi:hypothetical protein